MKKLFFVHLFLMLVSSVSQNLFCKGSTQNRFSLYEWSCDALQRAPEYGQQLFPGQAYPIPLFTAREFLALAQDFVSCHRSRNYNDARSWLNQKKPPSDFFVPKALRRGNKNAYSSAHVQRVTLPAQSQVCFVGDIHGSMHSLLRILWRLTLLGKLADDLTIIDPDFYMVFNGDYVDRGRYGIEVWYILLQLKCANWNKVFLLRGNHEDERLQSRYGFANELDAKFRDEAQAMKTTAAHLCTFLPHALYLGSRGPEGTYYFQCCHGGIELGFDPVPLLTHKDDMLQLIPQGLSACHDACNELYRNTHLYHASVVSKYSTYDGFNWSDFCQFGDGLIQSNKSRGSGYKADVIATQKYLDTINSHLTSHATQLVGFMRGHQDQYFGFKMLFAAEKYDALRSYAGYANGPFHWCDVVTAHDRERAVIRPADYVPVFTLSTATEGQSVPYDCFCIVTLEKTFNQSSVHIYEIPLPSSSERHEKYLSLNFVPGDHAHKNLSVAWCNNPTPQTLVSAALSMVVKNSKGMIHADAS